MSLYDDLGVAKDADTGAIKRAYRKGVHKAHPDKGGTAEKFHAIQKAYEVLSDDARRAEYDRTGKVDGAADKEGDVLRKLAFYFMSLLDAVDCDHTDLVGQVQQRLENEIAQSRLANLKIEQAIAQRERVKKRIKRKKAGFNMLAHMVDADIASKSRAIEVNNAEAENNRAMLKVLKDYKYDADAAPGGARHMAAFHFKTL